MMKPGNCFFKKWQGKLIWIRGDKLPETWYYLYGLVTSQHPRDETLPTFFSLPSAQ
jgi:hypothetical protein